MWSCSTWPECCWWRGNCWWELLRIVLFTGGWYATEDGANNLSCTLVRRRWFPQERWSYESWNRRESMSKRKKPFTVDYTGFGWVMIKKGVFERLEYPWFAPKMQVVWVRCCSRYVWRGCLVLSWCEGWRVWNLVRSSDKCRSRKNSRNLIWEFSEVSFAF